MTTPASEVPATGSRTLSILSLVASIAAIPLGHIVLLPLAAIVLGFVARTREPSGRSMSTAGIVVGFVVLFGWVLVMAIGAAVFVPLALLHHAF